MQNYIENNVLRALEFLNRDFVQTGLPRLRTGCVKTWSNDKQRSLFNGKPFLKVKTTWAKRKYQRELNDF
jgi:hypothetical protein